MTTRSFQIVVAGQSSLTNLTYNYNAPVINFVQPTGISTAGSGTLTITGKNFGAAVLNATVQVGLGTCALIYRTDGEIR